MKTITKELYLNEDQISSIMVHDHCIDKTMGRPSKVTITRELPEKKIELTESRFNELYCEAHAEYVQNKRANFSQALSIKLFGE